MLSIENSKVEDRLLVLLARFSSDYIQDKLIPEIEANCTKYNVSPALYEHFQRNKNAENSWYFAHSYAYADIPIGQTYEYIARRCDYKLIPESIVKCKAKVLCFFSDFKPFPMEYANHGHHEFSLIQFQDGIPDIIKELNEFTAKSKSLEYGQVLCLGSYETFQANVQNFEQVLGSL